jgi:hypothetical protein
MLTENRDTEGSCHCGAIQITVIHPPKEVTECHCSICFRYGALWAYYSLGGIEFLGKTVIYSWGNKNFEFHHCERCGRVVGWLPVDKSFDHCGVNARMLNNFDLKDVTHTVLKNA